MAKSAPYVAKCLGLLSPKMDKAQKLIDCLRTRSPRDCGAAVGFKDVKVAACISNPDAIQIANCLAGDEPELKKAIRLFNCTSKRYDAASVIADCAEGVLDDKTSLTLSCIARSGNDKAQLVGCAAGAALPPDMARLVGCASNSPGPTSFALCAAEPSMNEEWRIAAECLVETGGNPVGFAGCTAGQLTMRELSKCLTGEIGKDCFGPENTIVKSLTDAFNDLTHGPGQNNEIVKAITALGDLTGGPNSVIRNPGQILGGENSAVRQFIDKPLGGDNSVFHCPFGGC